MCSPVSIAKFLRTSFFTEDLQWLLLEGAYFTKKCQELTVLAELEENSKINTIYIAVEQSLSLNDSL